MIKSIFVLAFSIFWLCTISQTKPIIEWASIPAGTFIMGSPQHEVSRGINETQHQVTLSAFKMSKYEITVGQFKAFVDATGYKTDAEKGKRKPSGSKILSWERMDFIKIRGVSWKCDEFGNLHPATESNYPVIHISWNDASAFAAWMGCRLPTESEWEYACRASSTDPFNTGKNLTTCQANYDGNYPYRNNKRGGYRKKILPVGSFDPNAWGLYDMHGNIWEWCNDWYGTYSKAAQTNPEGPATGSRRVVRGGSWFSCSWYCRSAFRTRNKPSDRNCNIGFRLVSSE